MALKARSAKAKGTRLEKLVADDLQALGLEAGKQPGSGIYEDYPSDNWAIIHENATSSNAKPVRKVIAHWTVGGVTLICLSLKGTGRSPWSIWLGLYLRR